MSLCDTCSSPGHCCKKFTLSGSRGEVTIPNYEDPESALAWFTSEDLPFRPLERKEEGAEASAWWWTCPKLSADGRCTIYEQRPHVCRDFKAGSDPLCVHYTPPDAEVVTAPFGLNEG